ncbi:MAG TPA: polysaccharide deacetylase family protein [Nitrospira sp.]|nr:polysaccharide deacetylase family protein [Nitrospira sp.]
MIANTAAILAVQEGKRDQLSNGTDESSLAIRFALTFDDGPHTNTGKVLRQLTRNPVQSDVKAVFFVQTRHPQGGGSAAGRAMLSIEHAEGHVLGLHTGTARGHVRHTGMTPADLDRSLLDGKEVLDRITGRPTLLVRPPYWMFNSSTLSLYSQHQLHMMLSDVKAFDGVNWGVHLLRRWNVRSQLSRLRDLFFRGRLPVLNQTIPIVVTFHDTNTFTADHLGDYLTLLVEEASQAGLPLHRKPFLDDADELLQVGLRRATPHVPANQLTRTILEA